jgi:hypothetical protein
MVAIQLDQLRAFGKLRLNHGQTNAWSEAADSAMAPVSNEALSATSPMKGSQMRKIAPLLIFLVASSMLAAPSHLTGSIALGDPVAQDDGRYRIPVVIATDADSVAPQAFSFRLNFSVPVASAFVLRAGMTSGHAAVFEWQDATANTLSYLAVYDPAVVNMPPGATITVAEIVIASIDGFTPINIAFDPSSVTMLSNQGGTISATQANSALSLKGATINPTNWYPPLPPVRRRQSAGH